MKGAWLIVDRDGELAIAAAPDRAGVVLAVGGDATIDGTVRVAGIDDPAGCGGEIGAAASNSGTADDGAGGRGGGGAGRIRLHAISNAPTGAGGVTPMPNVH